MKRLSRQSSLPSNPGGGSDRGSRTLDRIGLFASRFRIAGQRPNRLPGLACTGTGRPRRRQEITNEEKVYEYNL